MTNILKRIGSKRLFIICTLLPAGIILFMLTFYPFLLNVWNSLFDYELISPESKPFIGLMNYKWVLLDPLFLNGLRLTIYYVSFAVILELIIGVFVAYMLSQISRGGGILRALLLLPMAATPVAVGLTWRLMYNPRSGLLNEWLRMIGSEGFMWTSSNRWVIPSLVLVDVWQWTPFVILIMLAGFLALPKEPIEAAEIDGASKFQVFLHISIPSLKPLIIIAALFRIIDSLKVFDIIWVMTAGGPGYASTTLNVLAFRMGFEFMHMGRASVTVIFILIIAILVSTPLMRWGRIHILEERY
ncbi:Trehalose transport system permease protein SugA [subsurface metagenome]|nr:ABC transporter permease subunit [Clostridia bacterium]